MGIGDYICVTLRGAAPWGFTVAQGEGDTYRPLVVSQVEDGGCAFQAGVQESDHVVSINGEPSADLTLEQARSLIDDATDCLQLLLKRCSSAPSEDSDPDETSCGDGLETTTLHILSPKHRPPSPRDLYISESQDEASYGGMDSEGPQLLSTELHLPHQKCLESTAEDVLMTLTPGNVVELQVSVAKSTLDCADRASVEKTIDTGDAFANQETAEDAHDDPQRSSHHGVVLGAPATSRQVEVVLQGAGRGDEGARRGVGGPEIGCEGEEESQEAHEPFTVTFAAEESAATEHRDSGESEEDPDQPHKHRARHARLRRSESLSEKQVKEAKSKCKRIALLLKAAPPNPNNKGVLMFKKHRQRAKKYTLVSYGTGEEDPESRSEEEEDDQDSHAVELTIVPSKDIELTNANSSTGVLKITFDKGLLELERNLNSLVKMECDTKGKGAFMFAQRRLKMDEISAEHEELRRQGIPVDGIQEVQKKMEEHAYMQSAIEGHGYMDVNMHQQSQQQYHQYQGQQYYEQQQQQQQHHQQQQQHHQEQQQHHQQLQQHHQQHHQQQQQHYQQQNYHQQQKNYEQQQQNYQQQQYQQQYEQQYQQQQLYQQREYHQEQQQYQQYSANMNGTIQQQTNEMQSSLSNRTAKPFTAQDMTPVAYSTANGDNQESQGEQIASRDERISTPAIKTGVLLDTRRRTGGKPMFSFKDAPKVSPNPELLHLLHRGDKKLGYESGTEEDYLSLGAEACNFLQSPGFKPKIPPPVAPKPMINPNALPWAVPLEVTNQDMPQCAENSMITPAVPPPTDTTPATEVEPAPASDPPAPSAPLEAPPTSTAEEQQWSVPTDEPQPQAPQVAVAPEDRIQMNSVHQPEPSPATSWPPAQPQPQPSNSWQQAPHQVPPHSGPSPQPQWVTHQPGPVQAPQPPTNSWSPQVQQAWAQAPEQIPAQTQVQPPWAQAPEQPSSQPPVQPPWAKEQPPLQQMQPAWTQPQEQQPLTSWVQQPQQKPQVQPPWGQQVPESQPQPPWVQQPQAPTQGWPQSHGQPQPQPPWVMSQQQPSWNPQQPQTQTPWMQSGQAPPPQPQAALNPWAPVPPQPQAQQPWAQQPPEQSQQPVNAWGPEQNQPQQQHPWAQQAPPPQAPQQPANNWEQPPVKTSPQPPAQTQPPHSWAQPSQPIPVSASLVNTQPSPKPWQAPQSRSSPPPPPPQRISSFTFGQRTSSPVNPMASVLPTSAGPAYEMLAVKGKGADMFAKRQSRMEKYVVDSETVEANKASRSTSPATSLPTEWKYSPNVRAPPSRAFNPMQSPLYPPAAQTSKHPPSSSPSIKSKKKEKPAAPPRKPLNVLEVMKHQPYQLNSSLFIFGPAEEAKPPAPKPECPPPNPNPPAENQPQISYEQMAMQQAGQMSPHYPPQGYGMPMHPMGQPMMHEGPYQQPPPNMYHYAYQQPPGPYQQMYNQPYQQPPPLAYPAQDPQSPSSPYQQAPQAPYPPTHSPPYMAAPSMQYQAPSTAPSTVPSTAPSYPIAARPESASAANPTTAPKPKFMAKKSSAQVWKPSAGDKE